MNNHPSSSEHAYGWRDFDQEVVEGLVENDSRFIDRRGNGWILSPLLGHYDTRLPWKDDNYKRGSVPAGDPPVSFRAAPTYVLEHPLDNIIAGREVIAEAVAGAWRHGEAGRLGNETSEGAVTWNVLRSLQEAGRLGVAASAFTARSVDTEPALGFWGRRDRARPRPAVARRAGRPRRVPPPPRVGLDADRRPLRRWHGDAPRCRGHRGVARALLGVRTRPLRRRSAPAGSSQGSPPPSSRRLRSPIGSGHRRSGRAGGRRRARSRERVRRSRAAGRPLPCGNRRRRVPSLHVGVALRHPRPGRRCLAPLRAYLENKSYGLRPAFGLPDEADEASAS